ncbi:unnamed protein product [Prorocentrum cordatum]|uniref:RNA-dependent RNA polymerase n=1 Tax=Prorocentrum cordatum TaxID=2364126 RepID=A0ABN9X3P1_9DINO|nr:unnamed protein product [Polarella glacialis]
MLAEKAVSDLCLVLQRHKVEHQGWRNVLNPHTTNRKDKLVDNIEHYAACSTVSFNSEGRFICTICLPDSYAPRDGLPTQGLSNAFPSKRAALGDACFKCLVDLLTRDPDKVILKPSVFKFGEQSVREILKAARDALQSSRGASASSCQMQVDDVVTGKYSGVMVRDRSRSPKPDHAAQRAVIIEGFRDKATGSSVLNDEDGWDRLRADLAHLRNGMKAEVDSDDDLPRQACDEFNHIRIVENIVENVWSLQESISGTFKDGSRLEQLVKELKDGKVDPMTDDFLVLNVASAKVRCRPGSQRSETVSRFYTFDHRRLWCMVQAGCRRIRLRIKPGFSGKAFNEFASKAEGLGRRITDVRVRYR